METKDITQYFGINYETFKIKMSANHQNKFFITGIVLKV
jgi:hypothetical protein